MEPERWQQIETLYHAAIERAPETRAAFLAEACADDPSLRREVEDLLHAQDTTWGFIDGNAMEPAARQLGTSDLSATKIQVSTGQQIGAYQILAPLGKGGMGEVHLAHDARLGRKVALKLLPAAFTHDQARVRRFEQEARGFGLEPSEHHHDSQNRRHRTDALHRHRIHRRRDATPAVGERAAKTDAAFRSDSACNANCHRASGCARSPHHSPRHQARKRDASP